MNKITFKDLVGDHPSEGSSALEMWYKSVQNIPIIEFDIGDICRSIRQELFVEYVLPVALQHLLGNPSSGELWDGELASVIARISKQFWRSHLELAEQTKDIMKSQDYSFDKQTSDEVNAFLQWMNSSR